MLAVVVLFAFSAANAAWNQECFYGKCCLDGILNQECAKLEKVCNKQCKMFSFKNAEKFNSCKAACIKNKGVAPKKAVMKPAPEPAPAAAAPVPADRLIVGRTVKIAGSNFDTNSAAVSPAFERYLKGKSSELEGVRFHKVIIIGFTDSTGDAAYNVDLSKRRAKAVADVFEKSGVPAEKIEHTGKGAADPIADNKTKEGRAENRRVEISVK